jgi:putative ABC transport system permease protein
MSLWRQITRGLRVLTNQTAADRELDEELQQYLDAATEAHIANGMAADAARRRARLDIGGPLVVREQIRASAWESIVATTAADVRYAARRLRATPTFTLVCAITLALGIGATTAIFSAVNPVLFEPLPYPEASRVATIWDRRPDYGPLSVTFGTYRELAERNHAFEALAPFKSWQPTVTGQAQPERLDGQRVGADYFRALGVTPIIGRDFARSDDVVNGPNVVVISDGLWRRKFGGDAGVIGRTVTLSGALFTITGVMPPQFDNVLAPSAEVWAPLQYDASLPTDGREWGHHLQMIGRLRRGVSIEAARRELDALARTRVAEFRRVPWATIPLGFIVDALQADVTRSVRPALLAVLGAVVLLLVIAGVNVTNLLLARGAGRRGELAMRAALGASRGRMVRQLITESLLLAVLGGIVGVAVAAFGVRALVALTPPGLPRASAIGVDGPVLAFAVVVTTLIGVVIGFVPAIHAARDLHVGLQDHSSRTAGGHRVARRTLVVLEVALALVLLVGAGLLLRSLNGLFAVAPGFDPSGVLTMQVQISGSRYADPGATRRFFDRALEAVRAVPGVAAAGWTSQLPLSGDFDKYGANFESSATQKGDSDTSALRYAISPSYLETMRIPLARGRLLDARDQNGSAPVSVLLSESLARRRFPHGDAIGQRMHLGRTDLPWYTVAGIVGDVKQTSLAVNEPEAVYITTDQWYSPDRVLSLVVRAQGDPAALTASIRNAVWSIDKDQPVIRIATLEQLVERSASERRFALVLFEAFALVALVLAATGIYGVLSGSVGERTREIGVRTALGASRTDIMMLVVGQGLSLTAIGAAIGVAAAALASRGLVTLLFGISPLDPATYLAVVAALCAVSAVACWIPAWRAARIDPAITLRVE